MRRQKNAQRGGEKLRIQNYRVQKDLRNWFGRFMKLLVERSTIMKLRCATGQIGSEGS